MTKSAMAVTPAGIFTSSVPEPPPIPELAEALDQTPQVRAEIAAALKEIDLDRPETLVLWGAGAQKRLGEVSARLVGLTKNKDAGPVGDTLRDLVLKLKGFKVDDIAQGERHAGLLGRFFRKAVVPIAVARERFDTVNNQVNALVRNLDRHIGKLLRDVVGLERIYAENVKAYRSVMVYIEAGKILLKEIDETRLPALKSAVSEKDALSSERYAKMVRFRQRLDRRIHNMELTRTALFQGLPAIGLVEDNDANLIERIQGTIANSVPLWYQQIALILATRNGMEAAQAERDANDFSNELLASTAKHLRISNKVIRTEIERGLFDADKIKAANDELVGAIIDSLDIYEDAVGRRSGEVTVIEQCERDLRLALEGIRPDPEDEAKH